VLHTPSPRPFQSSDTEACLALFDQNCPDFFAPNERAEFAEYLQHQGQEYWLYEHEGQVISAFGMHLDETEHSAHINWIMAAKNHHHSGIGKTMMREAILRAENYPTLRIIHISASQHSAPFFACFDAVQKSIQENGWGPRMHRVEMELSLQNSKTN
jgi:N-acetylglutamate synthase-like GNAT family acetyltransferase